MINISSVKKKNKKKQNKKVFLAKKYYKFAIAK
jgi:hypothetical protein